MSPWSARITATSYSSYGWGSVSAGGATSTALASASELGRRRRVGLLDHGHVSLERADHGDVVLVVRLGLGLRRRRHLDGPGQCVRARPPPARRAPRSRACLPGARGSRRRRTRRTAGARSPPEAPPRRPWPVRPSSAAAGA